MQPRALLAFSIVVDAAEGANPSGPLKDVRNAIKLYREADGLIWRCPGPLGDEVEQLPRPSSVKQAKADAILVYGTGSAPWFMRALGAGMRSPTVQAILAASTCSHGVAAGYAPNGLAALTGVNCPQCQAQMVLYSGRNRASDLTEECYL